MLACLAALPACQATLPTSSHFPAKHGLLPTDSAACACVVNVQSQQLQELDQLNGQLQFKYELASKELALQQQLSRELTQQLEAAEQQLQQAQGEQQSLLAELRHQQQLQLEMRLEQPAAEKEQNERLESLRRQIAGVQGVVADKEKNLQELTVKWNEAATHVEELQLQLQQESRNHQLLLRWGRGLRGFLRCSCMTASALRCRRAKPSCVLNERAFSRHNALASSQHTLCFLLCDRASQDSWAAHHARLLSRLEQYLEEIDTAESEAREAAAAAQATLTELHVQERWQLQCQQQQMEVAVQELEQKVHQLERDGELKQQQQEELTNMCAQVRMVCLQRVLQAAACGVDVGKTHRAPLGRLCIELNDANGSCTASALSCMHGRMLRHKCPDARPFCRRLLSLLHAAAGPAGGSSGGSA